jgi:hypothetical protein
MLMINPMWFFDKLYIYIFSFFLFFFSPWQIFLPFGRVLIYLFFWSSGFKLERFYEEWEEGEMVSSFWAVFCISRLKSIDLFMCKYLQGKKGEIRPPKLKTEDPNKSYVQRPVKRG